MLKHHRRSYALIDTPWRPDRSRKSRAQDLQYSIIVHICSSIACAASKNGQYRCPSLDSEGFIHCSTPEQVLEVANSLFRGQRGLVLLVIDPERGGPRIGYEDAGNSRLYPHTCGPRSVD